MASTKLDVRPSPADHRRGMLRGAHRESSVGQHSVWPMKCRHRPSSRCPYHRRKSSAFAMPWRGRSLLSSIEKSLHEVITYLDDLFHRQISIQLDQCVLVDAGVTPDLPVTLHIRNVQLKSALRRLLWSLDLTYLVRDDVLFITTRDQAESPDELVATGLSGGRSGGKSVLPTADRLDFQYRATEHLESIGGNALANRSVPACTSLVITQTISGHEKSCDCSAPCGQPKNSCRQQTDERRRPGFRVSQLRRPLDRF